MKSLKTIRKTYKGHTFKFRPTGQFNTMYETSVDGFSSYWYQTSPSVREAYRRFKNS